MSNWPKHHPDLSSPNFAGRSIREFDRGYVPYEPERIHPVKVVLGGLLGLASIVVLFLSFSLFV
jgi:hypothetical protein